MPVGLSSSQIIYWLITEEEYAMTISVCLSGEQRMRFVSRHGGFKLTYPFVGVAGTGENACIGIASRTIDSREALFWGPHGYYKVIRAWRAMKILEIADCIGETTLVACWSLFHPETRSALDAKYIKELAGQFRGDAELQKVYTSIANSFPAFGDLDVLLSGVIASGVYIDTDELLSEMRKRRLNVDSPTVRAVLARTVPKPHSRLEIQKSPIEKMIDSLLGIKS